MQILKKNKLKYLKYIVLHTKNYNLLIFIIKIIVCAFNNSNNYKMYQLKIKIK